MSDKSKNKSLKEIKLPQVDLVLRQPELCRLSKSIDRIYLAQLVRDEIQAIRKSFLEGGNSRISGEGESAMAEAVANSVLDKAGKLLGAGLRRVINGTGVILNTNLGRAPLPLSVLEQMLDIGQGYSNLEIDVKTGKRGNRTARISELLRLLTGCDEAIVVNNNASAVMLVVAALSSKRQVVVSRSELVEIGGSFRLPDVIESAGGILKEVGTTNKTRASDYEVAVNDQTGMFLRCHRSNFEIRGFTEDASMVELVEIAKRKSIPLVDDLGSGAFYDISRFGLDRERTVREVIESGVDVVTFSGDKLLGGPQAGIIAGRADLILKIRKNPMYRALRADKLILSLIENILSLYLSPNPECELPVLALSMVSADEVKLRVANFISRINGSSMTKIALNVVETNSTLGGGSLPGESIPSYGIEIGAAKDSNISAASLASILRRHSPPVITMIQREKVVIDFRTIMLRDEDCLLEAIASINDYL